MIVEPDLKIPIGKLYAAALEARERSYSPYSHYKVGTAVLLGTGDVVTGCNIENGGFTPSVCGERVALFKAKSDFDCKIEVILTVTENCATSCGVCLQVISELAPDAQLIFTDIDMKKVKIFNLKDLLKQPFDFSHEK